MSHAIAFHVPRPAWLSLLRARIEGASWSVCLGKGERPPRGATELHLFAGGRLRGVLPIDRVWNSCFGFWIDIEDPTRLRPLTLGPKTPPKRQPSASWWLGWRDVAWKDRDLVPFPGWATEGLSEEVRAEVADLVKRPLRSPSDPLPHFAPLDPYTVVPMAEPKPSAARVQRQAAQTEPAKPAASRQAPAAPKAAEPRPDGTIAQGPKATKPKKLSPAYEPEQLGLLLKGF